MLNLIKSLYYFVEEEDGDPDLNLSLGPDQEIVRVENQGKNDCHY